MATDSPDDETRALLKTWIAGWAAARGLAAPVAHDDGWRVEVGQAQQLRRHVFPSVTPALRALGEATREPWCYLKACTTTDALRAALPARWTVRPAPTWFMRFDGPPPTPRPLPAGYSLAVDPEPGLPAVLHARVLAADGTTAADGRLVVVDGHAVFDRIGTDGGHRRRGLGQAVMAALHARARADGARRGLLAATVDGHALYASMGWRVQSPYASAVIEGEPAAG